MADITCIRGADWIIAWDAAKECHGFLRDADLAFEGDRIIHVGKGYSGPCAGEVDGAGLLLMPGLVDIHAHPYNQAALKGVREELGNPHFYGSALYENTTLFQLDDDGRRASATYVYCELLRSGTTTLVDLAPPFDGWLEGLAQSGLRGCLAPMFSSARWGVREGREVYFEWDEQAGRRRFDAAVTLMDAADAHPSGRLFSLVAPAEIDTCSPALLRDSYALAHATRRPFQVHTSESVVQFNEIIRRHGKTPVQWAHELGILGPTSSLGHGIFLDHHSWIHWPTRDDMRILAKTGTSVAHSPTVFSRYGQTLQSFTDYRRAGINLGIGTDTFPHNMIEEMRTALIVGRITAGRQYDTSAADVFHAATVGGARLLGRDDIGRLAPGAKADLVLVDLAHPLMRPVRDPLLNLIFTAADRAVRDVYVGGRQVVHRGEVMTIDIRAAAERLDAGQARMVADVPRRDALHRSADMVAPLSLPNL
jgi:cytosine/adenosine deaminase-related metal-dependent hydrolase